ncbi:hypothetical protein [uncultured Variovorax sp.]|nr:hypothetical protein [uncultured Variovorax sp.]
MPARILVPLDSSAASLRDGRALRLVVHATRPMKESGSVPAQDDATAAA